MAGKKTNKSKRTKATKRTKKEAKNTEEGIIKEIIKEEEANMETKRGQTWSIDLVIAVIIFMLIIAVFYAFLNNNQEETNVKTVKEEAQALTTKIVTSEKLGLIEDNKINSTKLNELCNKSYEEIKKELGINKDFCIYIEDENGNIIPCSNNRTGIGNGKDIQLGEGITCGEILNNN